jgi:hypothetical protein
LDVDRLRTAIEELQEQESRARLAAAAHEARSNSGRATGSEGARMRIGLDRLGESYLVHRPESGKWGDVTWIVGRDPAVQMLHAETLCLEARIAKLAASAPAAR